MQYVKRERLTEWAVACLEKVGVPPPEAKLVGESLVQTSVWGVDSHGVLRLTHYLRRMTIGSISPTAAPVVMRTGPVTAQVHGHDGLGIVHATLGMEEAIEMAQESGVGVVGVGHSSHCGAMGLYTRMAAKEQSSFPMGENINTSARIRSPSPSRARAVRRCASTWPRARSHGTRY